MTTVQHDSRIPPQLFPTVRVGNLAPGIDPLDRLRTCYLSAAPDLDETAPELAADAHRPLLVLTAADALAEGHSKARVRAVTMAANQLLSKFEPLLPPPLGEVVSLRVTCTDAPQQGFAAGTVVVVRDSNQVTEQYILRHIRVDLRAGTVSLVGLPTTPMLHRPAAVQGTSARPSLVMPMDGLDVGHKAVQFALSVAPFLPEPWNALATGGLSIFNMLMDGADDTESPFMVLKQEIEDFIITDDLRKDQGVLTEVSDHFENMKDSLSTPIEDITSTAGAVQDLATYIDTEALPKVRTANGDLWTILMTRSWNDYDATLGLLVRGVSLNVMLEKYSTQIQALNASVAKKNDDLKTFTDQTDKWTAHVATIAKDVGEPPADPWDTDACYASTSWLPKIEGWMAKARGDRLALISDCYYTSWGEVLDGSDGGPGGTKQHYGWSWYDQGAADSSSDLQSNMAEDTPGSGCCDDPVQHKDVAQANHDAHVNQVGADFDAKMQPHRDTVESWTTFVGLFREQLPNAAPTGPPTVTVKADGPTTPRPPVWNAGATVRYAVSAVNTKGPSPSGPWSDEYKVGATAFTTLTGLAASDTTDTLWLYRQMRQPGADWSPMRLSNILVPPIPASYDDTDTET